MDDVARIWQEIAARPDGPMAFRFYLQPMMAAIYAVLNGLQDANEGKPPYFWALFTEPANRAANFCATGGNRSGTCSCSPSEWTSSISSSCSKLCARSRD